VIYAQDFSQPLEALWGEFSWLAGFQFVTMNMVLVMLSRVAPWVAQTLPLMSAPSAYIWHCSGAADIKINVGATPRFPKSRRPQKRRSALPSRGRDAQF
jgi:hypothetical protein